MCFQAHHIFSARTHAYRECKMTPQIVRAHQKSWVSIKIYPINIHTPFFLTPHTHPITNINTHKKAVENRRAQCKHAPCGLFHNLRSRSIESSYFHSLYLSIEPVDSQERPSPVAVLALTSLESAVLADAERLLQPVLVLRLLRRQQQKQRRATQKVFCKLCSQSNDS